MHGDPRDYDPNEDPVKRALEEDEDKDIDEGEHRDEHG